MTSSALTKGARGGATVLVGQFAKLALQLIGMVTLARLLTPSDFGLVAMVTAFSAFGALLRDFGISTAALQARKLTHQQASNLFWVSSGLALIVAAALALSAPLLVGFYSEPRLSIIVPVLAIGLVLDGVQSQVQVHLTRAMKFMRLTSTDLMAQICGIGLAIAAAWAGWGYWALVVQVLVASLALLIGRTIAARWIPAVPRRGFGSKSLITAGAQFGLAQVLSFAANNADTLAIGTRWGPTNLGFYNQAFRVFDIPRTGILGPLTQVAIPTINEATEGGERQPADLLLRIQFLISLALTWIYLIAATTADWLIPLALGEQWAPSVPLFQALSVAGVFAGFGTVSYWMFIVSQQSRHLLYLHLVTKPLGVLLIVAAVPFGVQAVAFAFTAGMAVAWPINLIWLARTTGQDSWAFLRLGLRVIGAGVIAFATARWALSAAPTWSSWASIAIGALTATVMYLLALVAVPGGLRHLSSAANYANLLIRRG